MAKPEPTHNLKNPVTRQWLSETLHSTHPRLILTPDTVEKIREAAGSDTPAGLVYRKIREEADTLLEQPPLTREFTGRRLLFISRQALGRTTTLALAYLVEQDPAYLARLEAELTALCGFVDWNPAHFLDVAEMATALAFPLDWCGEALSLETRRLVVDSLLNKALLPSLEDSPDNWWIDSYHNWNLVCHGGLAIASLAVFEEYPEIATSVIHRSIEQLPLGLIPYAPDGAYNEGPSYWFYATDFLTLTLSAYRTAIGTDFGIPEAEGLKASALFSLLAAGPSGDFYNYSDAGTRGFLRFDHFGLFAWFIPELGQDLPKRIWDRLPQAIEAEGLPIDRMSVFYLVNLIHLPEGLSELTLPRAWVAGGPSPVGILRPETDDGLWLAAKGGSADDNHAHMDAGSFVLEWKGIRWAIDPTKPGYTAMEAAMGAEGLWNRSQDSPRWTLVAHNNFGHSTLTVNGEKLATTGRARATALDLNAEEPSFTFELSEVYPGRLDSARRTFKRISEDSLQITDTIRTNASTHTLAWHFITTAQVAVQGSSIQLGLDGEQLKLEVRSPSQFEVNVVPLFPPVLSYDSQIPDLKRIEILVTPDAFDGPDGQITVDVSGQPAPVEPQGVNP